MVGPYNTAKVKGRKGTKHRGIGKPLIIGMKDAMNEATGNSNPV